jgi:hypothetical protein
VQPGRSRRAVHLREHGTARKYLGGGAQVPECEEESLGDIVAKSHTQHTPERRGGVLSPRNDVVVIPDGDLYSYLQSHIFDLYSVGSNERRKSMPFIQNVLLQGGG